MIPHTGGHAHWIIIIIINIVIIIIMQDVCLEAEIMNCTCQQVFQIKSVFSWLFFVFF